MPAVHPAQRSYFGEGVNGRGLSASLHNENESARETYLCANELSASCWNFTAIIKAFFLPVQRQLPVALPRLLAVRLCECPALLTTLTSPCCRWDHSPATTLQDPYRVLPDNRAQLCPGKADFWISMDRLPFYHKNCLGFPQQSFANT